MSVYVDKMRLAGWIGAGFRGSQMKMACHMMADTDQELEVMRKRLGLRPSWRHGDHYDLTESKRADAIRSGAISVSATDLVALRQRRKEAE